MTDSNKDITVQQAVDKLAKDLIAAFSLSINATDMEKLVSNTDEIKKLIQFTMMLGQVYDVTVKHKPEWMIPMTIMAENAIYLKIRDMKLPKYLQHSLAFAMQHIAEWQDVIPAAELKLHSFLQQEHDKIGER